MGKLEACPICKTDTYVYTYPSCLPDKVTCGCNVCGASVGPCETEEEAENKWNKLIKNKVELVENEPLTFEQLKKLKNPIWLGRREEWAFISTMSERPYKQIWYLASDGMAKTVLFEHELFFKHK